MKRVRFALCILSLFIASGLTIFFRTEIQHAIVTIVSAQGRADGEKPVAKTTRPAVIAMGKNSDDRKVMGKVLAASDALQGVLNINVPTIFNSAVDIASSITRGDASIEGILTVAGKSILQGPVSLENDLTGEDVNIALTGDSEITAPNLLYSITAGDGLSISGTQKLTITNTDLGSSQKIIKSIKVGSDTLSAGSNTSTFEFRAANGLTLSTNTSDNIITFGASGAELNVSGFTDDGSVVRLSTSTDSVGIGTTSPDLGKKLHVVGDTKFEGSLLVTGIANFSGGAVITSGIDNQSGGISNAGSITGATGFTSSGTITFSGLSTGIVRSSFAGVLTSSAIDLTSADVSGILPSANGGTGIDGSTYLAGDILYASSNGVLSRLGVGGTGQVLTVAGGVPTWGASSGGTGPCTNCVITDPGSTQTITATGSGAIALSVRPSASGTVDIFNVTDNSGATKYFRVDKDGNVILGTGTTSTTGNLTVAPANTDYLAIAPVAQGAASFTGSITSEDLTAARTWTFPDATGTICLTTGNCNGVGSNFGGSGTTNYIAKFNGTYAVQNSLLYDNGSAVGIGTASPAYSLDISGNLRALGNTVIGGTLSATGAAHLASTLQVSGAASMLSTLNVAGAATLSSTLSVTGNGLFNGNVGIGTTAPSTGLHVYSSTVGTKLTVQDSNSFGARWDFISSTNGNTGNTGDLKITAGASGQSSFSLQGGGNAELTQLKYLNGSVTWALGAIVPSSAMSKWGLKIDSTQIFLADGSGNFGITTATTLQAPLFVSKGYGSNASFIVNNPNSGDILTASSSGTTRLILSNAGNLGMGTTSPIAPLHISTGYGLNAAMIVNQTLSGNILAASASGTTKMVLTNGGNLGIGTLSPSYALEVSSVISDGPTYNGIRITNSAGTGSGRPMIDFYNSAGSTSHARVYSQVGSGFSTAFFGIQVANSSQTLTDRLNIDVNGNIGMGTTTPVARLHLTGGYGANAALIVNNTNSGDLFTASASGTSRLTLTNAGNLGIGTTSPAYKLDVVGAAGSNAVRFSTGSGGGPDGGYLTFVPMAINQAALTTFLTVGYNEADANKQTLLNFQSQQSSAGVGTFAMQTSTGRSLSLQPTSGNVGIGTTSPQTTLDVVGTASVSSTLTMGGAIQPSNGSLTFNYKSGTNTWAAGMTLNTVGFLGIGTTAPSALLDVVGTTTTGTGMRGTFNSLSTGTGWSLTSTSTSFSTGTLGSLDWSPGSTTVASGDLLSLNVGANGTIGNLLNIKNAGSSIFAVSQSQVTIGVPTQFSAPGDVGIAYDIAMSNPVASFIKSSAPLYLQAGETFNSSDLTLRTYNAGNLVLDTSGGVTLLSGNNWSIPTASTSAWTIATTLMNFDTANQRVGIGTTTPQATLGITGTASVSSTLTMGGAIQPSNGPLTINYKSGTNAWTAGMTLDTAGNLGLGTTVPTAQLHTTGTIRFASLGAGTVMSDANGNLSSISDERLKIIQGSFSRGLSDLMKLTPKIYKWNEMSGLDQVNNYAGFIAQNVQSAIPEATFVGPNGYLSLQDRPILATAINAIKEQQGMINLLSGASTSAQLTAVGSIAWKDTVESRLTSLEAVTATMSGGTTPITQSRLAQVGGVHLYAQWMNQVWTFLSQVVFNDIVTFNEAVTFAKDMVIAGRVTSKDLDSAGFAIIDAGKQQVAVTFEKAYTSKPIISLTAEDYDGSFSTHEATRGGFFIRLSTPAAEQVVLHWKATEVEGAKIMQGSTELPTPTPGVTPTPTPSSTPAPTSDPNASGSGTTQ